MEPILFVLMLVMIAVGIIVYAASVMEQQGQAWAHQVCDLYNACDHVYWLFAVTVIAMVLYFISRRIGIRPPTRNCADRLRFAMTRPLVIGAAYLCLLITPS